MLLLLIEIRIFVLPSKIQQDGPVPFGVNLLLHLVKCSRFIFPEVLLLTKELFWIGLNLDSCLGFCQCWSWCRFGILHGKRLNVQRK